MTGGGTRIVETAEAGRISREGMIRRLALSLDPSQLISLNSSGRITNYEYATVLRIAEATAMTNRRPWWRRRPK